MSRSIDPNLISLRDLTENEISAILDYWFRSPPRYVESLGADPSRLPPEAEMKKKLVQDCVNASRLGLQVIFYGEEAVGFHTLFPFVAGDFGVFHAHIFRPDFRGRGLASYTYPRCALKFMDRFRLKRILYKTPAHNLAAIKVKEKLGFRRIGEETLNGLGIIQDGTRAVVFELTREDAEKYRAPFELRAVGYVRSSRVTATDDDWDREICTIELTSHFSSEALIGLTEFSHVEVLFYMNQVGESERQFGARHPRGDKSYPLIGVFAQRGKNRPNPIGLTVCRVVSVEGKTLTVSGLDAIEGTPVLDLKPWFNEFGPRGSVTEPSWVSRLMAEYWVKN